MNEWMKGVVPCSFEFSFLQCLMSKYCIIYYRNILKLASAEFTQVNKAYKFIQFMYIFDSNVSLEKGLLTVTLMPPTTKDL